MLNKLQLKQTHDDHSVLLMLLLFIAGQQKCIFGIHLSLMISLVYFVYKYGMDFAVALRLHCMCSILWQHADGV